MLVNVHKLMINMMIMLIGFACMQNQLTAQTWSLTQCIDTALVNNKTLSIAKNMIGISEQKNKEAKAGFIPKINANAEYKYYIDLPYQLMPLSLFGGPDGQFKEVQFGVPHALNINGQIGMPLFNPQLIGGIEGSNIGIELSRLNYQKSEEKLILDIYQLYYNAQALQYQIRFTDSSLTNLKQIASKSEVLRNQQMIKGSDFTRIELQVEQLGTQKEIVINKYEQVIATLKFAMGISAERNIEVLPLEELSAPRNYNRAVISDIKLAMMQENRTRTELRALKLSYIPSLSIFATYGTTGLGYNKSPNEFFNFYPMGFVGVQMVYPLFDGTITLRKIKQKKLELENNELLTSLANEQNEMLLTNAKRYRQQAYQTVLNAKNQIQLSKTIYEQVKLQHAEGLASMTDVLLADNSFRESEQTYLNAVIEFLKSDIELKQLSGEKLYNK